MITRFLLSGFFLFQSLFCIAQQSSREGWFLSTKGTIRVLTVFVEIEHDTLPERNRLPKGNDAWPIGKLPIYADSIFDPYLVDHPIGKMTRYYEEASFGNLHVLGDYFPELIKVPYSRIVKEGRIAFFRAIGETINARLAIDSTFSKHNFSIADFDIWNDTKKSGTALELRGDDPFEGVDHVMVITRNYVIMPHANGMASGSSMTMINEKRTNTYSLFAGGSGFPFDILRHEFNHLLIGGNNFHSGGGNSPRFSSYFPFVQGGWGMMGAENSSLLTCSGWDRRRLGWKPVGNTFEISARDTEGKESNGDLTVETGGGEFVLRDFERMGDVIRIKLPFIPEGEYQQWLWIENHTTEQYNGSEFDIFHYQKSDCISDAQPGLYMYVQVDADVCEGQSVYNVKADMRRPVLADGNYDFRWEPEKADLGSCINNVAYYPYYLDPESENPLTGNHTQEFPQYYTDSDSVLTAETVRTPFTHKIGDVYERIAMMGNPRQAFREGANAEIGIGTNPTTASMLTMVNSRKPARISSKDNRVVYLNGIKISIVHTFPDMSVKVRVDFDDNQIVGTRRWCAPEIVLNNHAADKPDLVIVGKLILDIGKTMTRFDKPIKLGGSSYFTDPTRLEIKRDAEIRVTGDLELKNQSVLVVHSGAQFTAEKGSKVQVRNGSSIRFDSGSAFAGKGKIKIGKGCRIECADTAIYDLVQRRTWNKKRVVLIQD